MIDYRTCNECTEKHCLCERSETQYETKLKEKFPEETSVNYELNY